MAGIARRLLTNIASSWIGYAVRLAIAFFFVPYITSVLGDARYGVWIIIFQVVSYLFLFDIGLEKALARYLPRFLGLDDFPSLNKVMNSATAIYGVVAGVVLIATVVIANVIFPQFSIADPTVAAEGQAALLIVGLVVAIRFLFFPFGGSLGAFHRFDIAKGLEMAEEVLRTIVYIILLANGYGLVSLAVTLGAFALTRNIAGVLVLRKLHPEVRFDLKSISRETVGMLLTYSRTSFAIALVWIGIYNSDSVVLGLLASSALVGVYAPGAQVMLYFRHLVNAIAIPLLPALVHLESTRDLEVIRQLYVKGIRIVAYAGGAMAAGVWILGRPFIELWLAPAFHHTYIVLYILAGGAMFLLPQLIGNAVLFALDKHRYLLLVLLLEMAMKISLMVAGLLGWENMERAGGLHVDLAVPHQLLVVAIASALPHLVLYTTLYPLLMRRAIQVKFWTILGTHVRAMVLGLLMGLFPALLMKKKLIPDDWFGMVAGVVIVGLVVAVPFYFFILEHDDRRRIAAWLRRRG